MQVFSCLFLLALLNGLLRPQFGRVLRSSAAFNMLLELSIHMHHIYKYMNFHILQLMWFCGQSQSPQMI